MAAKSKLFGYNGKILRIDLTTARIKVETRPDWFYRNYIGGRGFIIQTLLAELPKGIDPLGNENKLVFALGPFTGHPLVGGGRNSIGAKSPLTGGYGESEVGGFWGAKLRRAGYDAIIVEGKSENPVYIWIDNSDVRICDASKIWGLEIADAEDAIKEEIGDNKINTATIGPGGEKLVRYACIINDTFHVAGRTGMGAVMGSKTLKAIAVRGKKAPEIFDRQKILELSRWMTKNFKTLTRVCEYGTGATITDYEASGNLPIRNFKGGRFPGVEKIRPQSMFEKSYVNKMDSCFGCPIRCKRRVQISKPWKTDPRYGGPEYETLAALGSNCCIDNLEALIKANEICNRYGIDTMSTGGAIAFAMECFENGILTSEDTEGLNLTFGNAKAMIKMVEKIALRKGLGDLLAEGTKRASEIIGQGSDKFAMHVKGLEIGMHEPRYKQGMGLHYSVHATGADHATGIHDNLISKNSTNWESIDLAETIPNTELSPRKARMLYHEGIWRQMGNYLGLCLFIPWTYKQIRDAMEYITGWPMSYWKLMKAVERGITLSRIYNIREGFSINDDRLPGRFASSPSDGPLKGVTVDPEKLADAQKAYYQMLGWDESGIPTLGRLVELNIEWSHEHLQHE